MLPFGELMAVLVAFCWACSAIFFEYAGKRIGSLSVNLYRLLFGFLLLGLLLFFLTGSMFPQGADARTWLWMSLSGFAGFVFGDLCLFYAYVLITSRFSQLIMTLSPPLAAFSGWLILSEKMSWMGLAGMVVTLFGVGISIFKRNASEGTLKLNLPLKGVLLALGGALGQGLGLVLSKQGMIYYEQAVAVTGGEPVAFIPFAATQMRIITGIIGFSLIILFTGRAKQFAAAFKNRVAVTQTFFGSIFGPFIGVSLSLIAVRNANTGVATTIMATTPIVLILLDVLVKKKKVSFIEVLGAVISVAGVSLFFIR